MPNVEAAHLADFCPELRGLLDAELAAGNAVAETHRGWNDPTAIVVLLAFPFRAKPETLPSGVVFREVNDPHWWLAEYAHSPTNHLLACRF